MNDTLFETFENETDYDSSVVADSTKLMLKQFGQFELLSFEEEKELTRRAAVGDKEAKQKLVNHNLRLVMSIARKYKGTSLSFQDLVQEGTIGLMKAIDKFDPSKDFRFSTYATYWIKQTIGRALAEQNKVIRIPVHMTDLASKVNKATQEYLQTNGEKPTEKEIAVICNISVEKVKEVWNLNKDPLSLDVPVDTEEDATMGDLIADNNISSPIQNIINDDRHNQILNVLNTLSEKEANVIRMRFGLDDGEPKTLAEIGKRMGYTREWIRLIEEKAMRKLRSPIRKNMLVEYLN